MFDAAQRRTGIYEMRRVLNLLIPLLLALTPACRRVPPVETAQPPAARPNILWVVWDTVRRDHLSVYGYERPTTPRVEQWARGARVFTNCISAGSTTVPAHVSMFTGLLPYQHGAHNRRPAIVQGARTLAELLAREGYDTYLYSANPYIARDKAVTRGFDTVEHPWDDQYRADAVRLITAKIDPRDQSTELAQRVHAGDTADMPVVKAGKLAQTAVRRWIDQRDNRKPYFIFLNYMEAHRPFLPAREYREMFLSPEQLERSYRLDRTWPAVWAYTFGVRDYSAEELAIFVGLYDAALRELDELFGDLIASLDKRGMLDDTIVILTADHGEHLGDHHLLDHQYSVYNELLYVPLIVHYPPAFAPGRDQRPVMNFDLYPTLLQLAGVTPPSNPKIGISYSLNLRDVPARRRRLAEYPQWMPAGLRRVREVAPDFDPTPWRRSLRGFYSGSHKLIWASDGRHELYDLASDPHEQHNLAPQNESRVRAMLDELKAAFDIQNRGRAGPSPQSPSQAEMKRLEALGYAAPGEDNGADEPPP
ncbi:MAG: DUF229 domain-containing protein [Planctomycetota bacterium]|nr:MAG: DUF229 domain-containing protein [Planctomycetota bacterium]